MGLKFLELAGAFLEFAQDRGALGQEEFRIVGGHDHSVGAEGGLACPVSQHAVEIVTVKGAEAGFGNAHQIRVLAGRERADKVIGAGVEGRLIVFAVIAFVVDECDLVHALGEKAVTSHDGLGNGGEAG